MRVPKPGSNQEQLMLNNLEGLIFNGYQIQKDIKEILDTRDHMVSFRDEEIKALRLSLDRANQRIRALTQPKKKRA